LNDNAYFPYATGGTYIEFSKANQTSSLTQINLGYSYKFTQEHLLDVDLISGSSGETSASIFAIGYSYNLELNEFMTGLYFQPSLAFGSASVTNKLGTVKANGTMPFVIPRFAIRGLT